MKRDYISASSAEKFSQCAASWITNYDDDLKVKTGNFYSEIGNLIHFALELWNDPTSDQPRTYEFLEECFLLACTHSQFAETHAQFKRAKELLASAYRLATTHPAVPMHLSQTLSVEQELVEMDGTNWQPEGMPMPIKGSIDRVSYIPVPSGAANEIILLIEDYKTGRAQSHSELTQEKIQAPLYHAYARSVLVPMLEAQGYTVKRLLMIWTFIGDGTAVTMYDADFDDTTTLQYLASIARQQVDLMKEWNKIPSLPASNDKQKKFLEKYEKPNPYCSYCPRKGECQTFGRLLSYKSVIDITDPNTTWDEIWADYEKVQAIVKEGERRLDSIKSIVPVYLDQEKLPSIKLKDGREIVANQQTREEYRVDAVEEIFGTAFLLRNAKVTKTAIEKELALIAKTDPDKAQRMTTELLSAYNTTPGPRPVLARKGKS